MRSSTRFRRGITALLILLALLIGLPATLLAAYGSATPDQIPSWSAVQHGLTDHPDVSGRMLLSVGVAVAWIAWFTFAFSVVLELFGRVRNRPVLRIPGLGTPRRAAGRLLARIALMLGTVGSAGAYAAEAAVTVVATMPGGQHGTLQNRLDHHAADHDDSGKTDGRRAETGNMVYHVRHGDRLGDIAKRFLGDVNEFGQIARINRHLIGAYGPDLIRPGWVIELPAGAVDHGPTTHAGGAVTTASRARPIVESATLPQTAVPDPAGMPPLPPPMGWSRSVP